MNDERIETLSRQLPALFDIREVQEATLSEGHWVFDRNSEDGEDAVFDIDELLDSEVSHEEPLERRYPDLAETLEGISDIFGGGFSGAPVTPGGTPRSGAVTGSMPPTEALAFYLPYHRFGPGYWGIYIILEGLVGFARDLRSISGARLTGPEAWRIAKNYLFRHEQYHHKVETACTRFECVLHKPIYNTHASALYGAVPSTLAPNVHHEEAVATWYGIKETATGIPKGHNREIGTAALETFMDGSPAPYRRYRNCSSRSRAELYTEILSRETQKADSDVMSVFSHVDHPDLKWTGRAVYICRKGSGVARRARLGGRLVARRRLLKLLQKEAPGVVEASKSHPSRYRTLDGLLKSDLPGSKDIPLGTCMKICKDLGITKTAHELLGGAR